MAGIQSLQCRWPLPYFEQLRASLGLALSALLGTLVWMTAASLLLLVSARTRALGKRFRAHGISFAVSIYFSSYAPVAQLVVGYWACGKVDGARYLRADPIVLCDGELHRSWRGLALLGLLLWVVLPPLLLGIAVWCGARRGLLARRHTQMALGVAYRQFTPSNCLWSLVETSKKLAFASLAALFEGEPVPQIGLLLLLILSYAMLHASRRPFVDRLVDRVAFSGHVAIFLLLLCGLLLRTGAALPGSLVAGMPLIPLLIASLSFAYVALELGLARSGRRAACSACAACKGPRREEEISAVKAPVEGALKHDAEPGPSEGGSVWARPAARPRVPSTKGFVDGGLSVV